MIFLLWLKRWYASFKLSVKVEGGHSSIPARETAIDVMSSAIAKLKQNPFENKKRAQTEWP